MSFKSRYYAIIVMVSLLALAPLASAQAGNLFPPANIGANPNIPCPNGSVLSWSGDSVTCTDPTPGVTTTTSCPTGQVMMGVSGGKATCVPLSTTSTCPTGQVMMGVSAGAATCVPLSTTSTCPTGQVMMGMANGSPVCASLTSACGAGSALTYTGGGFACVNVDQQANVPTCTGGNYLTFNGSSFGCSQQAALNVSCAAGQVLTGISNGLPVCVTANTSGSSGWVTVPSEGYNTIGNWVLGPDYQITPTQWCAQNGYTNATGACRGIYEGDPTLPYDGFLAALPWDEITGWHWACEWGGGNEATDANTQILCVK